MTQRLIWTLAVILILSLAGCKTTKADKDLVYAGKPDITQSAKDDIWPDGRRGMRISEPIMPPRNIPEDALHLDNGVAYRITKSNPNGAVIGDNDIVSLDLSRWRREDSALVETSADSGVPFAFHASALPTGLEGIIKQIRVGERVQYWTPQAIDLEPGESDLKSPQIFDVVVLSATPRSDVSKLATLPQDVEKTPSGLVSKVLKAGDGDYPTAHSRVAINYMAYRIDGKLMATNILLKTTHVVELDNTEGVIQGMLEGIKLMRVGEARRFWMPPELTSNPVDGILGETVVFDIELVKIL